VLGGWVAVLAPGTGAGGVAGGVTTAPVGGRFTSGGVTAAEGKRVTCNGGRAVTATDRRPVLSTAARGSSLKARKSSPSAAAAAL
jgi:hypothetical protein